MLGLIVVLAVVAYLVVSIFVVLLVVRWARRGGRNVKSWGVSAAFFMYLLVFWDHIPTIIYHDYRCHNEAGFWLYKNPSQWASENRNVLSDLVPIKNSKSENGAYKLNERFRWSVKKNGPYFPNLWINQQEIFDVETGEVMARYVDFSRGYGNPLASNSDSIKEFKFWLIKDHCDTGRVNQGKMYSAADDFRYIRDE